MNPCEKCKEYHEGCEGCNPTGVAALKAKLDGLNTPRPKPAMPTPPETTRDASDEEIAKLLSLAHGDRYAKCDAAWWKRQGTTFEDFKIALRRLASLPPADATAPTRDEVMRLVLDARKAAFENGIESAHPNATETSKATAIGYAGRSASALDAALVRLVADAERLDWLEATEAEIEIDARYSRNTGTGGPLVVVSPKPYGMGRGSTGTNLRAAVDAARSSVLPSQEKCPTCGSKERGERGEFVEGDKPAPIDAPLCETYDCIDPWHRATPDTTGATKP